MLKMLQEVFGPLSKNHSEFYSEVVEDVYQIETLDKEGTLYWLVFMISDGLYFMVDVWSRNKKNGIWSSKSIEIEIGYVFSFVFKTQEDAIKVKTFVDESLLK